MSQLQSLFFLALSPLIACWFWQVAGTYEDEVVVELVKHLN